MRVGAVVLMFALLAAAVPAAAQQRGTLEFGGFGGTTRFDNGLALDNSWGGGVRIGAYLNSRWSVEFEGSRATAALSSGASDVNVDVLSARVTTVPATLAGISVLIGAGVDHTDTEFLSSYGFHALLGAKVMLSNEVFLRVDGIQSHIAEGDSWNTGLRVGFGLYRHSRGR